MTSAAAAAASDASGLTASAVTSKASRLNPAIAAPVRLVTAPDVAVAYVVASSWSRPSRCWDCRAQFAARKRRISDFLTWVDGGERRAGGEHRLQRLEPHPDQDQPRGDTDEDRHRDRPSGRSGRSSP